MRTTTRPCRRPRGATPSSPTPRMCPPIWIGQRRMSPLLSVFVRSGFAFLVRRLSSSSVCCENAYVLPMEFGFVLKFILVLGRFGKEMNWHGMRMVIQSRGMSTIRQLRMHTVQSVCVLDFIHSSIAVC